MGVSLGADSFAPVDRRNVVVETHLGGGQVRGNTERGPMAGHGLFGHRIFT